MKSNSNVGKITSTANFLRYLAKFFANIRYPFSKNSRDLFKDRFLKDFCGDYIYKRVSRDVYESDFNQNDIPLFVISFNNLTYLRNIIEILEKYNLTNIHIIDNNSDYPPLVNYLKDLPYKVHFLDKNFGHRVLWDSHIFDDIIYNQVYAVTDPDLEFNPNLPNDFLYQMYKLLVQFPNITKVGFALKIDDLQKSDMNNMVLLWEKQFWKDVQKDNNYELYRANIDTTFALYRPGKIGRYNFYTGLRIAGNFCAKHLPWYGDCVESSYYRKTASAKSASWALDSSRYAQCSKNQIKINSYELDE